MKYNVYEPFSARLSRFILAMVSFTIGGFIGLTAGGIVCLSIIADSTPVLSDSITPSSELRVARAQVSVKAQPAAGSGWVQEPSEGSYLPVLNQYYRGPALMVSAVN